MTDSITETPILIVGGGPIGLALAVDLGWRGIECILVEQSDGTIDLPRANTIDLRTMEQARRWGITDAIRKEGLPADYPHTALYATSLGGYELARFARVGLGDPATREVSPERPQRCNQLFFDPILRARAAELPGIDMRFNTRFDDFTQNGESVTATVTDTLTGANSTIRSRYMIACCGGRSPIRKTLGIPLGEEGILGYPVSVFFRAEKLWEHHDKGKTALNFLINAGGVWATLIPLDGRELWRITLHGSKDYLDPATIDADDIIRRVAGFDFDYELIACGNWTRREMVANQYRWGRVLLAGDAAHQNTPTGGYGMNTGLGDAVDLGWKLSALLEGWAGENLLDSYQAERRPVAVRNVTEATANFHRRNLASSNAVTADTEEGRALRAELGERLQQANQRQHQGYGIALGHIYADSPICRYDGEGDAPDTVQDFVETTYPGARAPHAALGEGRSTLDLFGRGFVLLRFPGAPDPASLADAAKMCGVPFEIIAIDDADIATLYERALVLVRPDGNVAWRSNALPEDPQALIDHVRGAR